MPRRVERDPSAESDEQRAPRSSVKEQGNMRLSFLRDPRRCSSHLEPIVKFQNASAS